MLDNRKVIWDSLCEMKDAGAIASSAAAQVDSSDKIFDTGGGYTEGVLDLNVTVSTASSGTSIFTISLEGSADSAFATPTVELANLEIGDAAALRSTRTAGVGLYKLKWSNMFNGTVYRYLRVYTTVAGSTPGVGVNYTAVLSK
jgi:hypothetical protein